MYGYIYIYIYIYMYIYIYIPNNGKIYPTAGSKTMSELQRTVRTENYFICTKPIQEYVYMLSYNLII